MPGADDESAEPPQDAPGPTASWRDMVRDLDAQLVVHDAEAYAAGERRLTVFHGLQGGRDVDGIVDAVDEALRAFPGAAGHPFTALGFTRWRFRPPAAAEQLVAAREAIARINPDWRFEADEH
jgi:hypothetical protein